MFKAGVSLNSGLESNEEEEEEYPPTYPLWLAHPILLDLGKESRARQFTSLNPNAGILPPLTCSAVGLQVL